MNFAPGLGTLLISKSGAKINDATITRQHLTRKSGLLVLASDASRAKYYTARLPLPVR